MNIGFIGPGVMGRPMAGHLIDAGHTLFLHRVKEVSQFLVRKGGKTVDSLRAVADQAELIILMVPDTPVVEQVVFGENGVASGLKPGKLVIDMSSISPVATKQFAAKIEEFGCDYLDAPVSGGEVGTATTQQLMNAAVAMGEGEKDHSGLIMTLEALAGQEN